MSTTLNSLGLQTGRQEKSLACQMIILQIDHLHKLELPWRGCLSTSFLGNVDRHKIYIENKFLAERAC